MLFFLLHTIITPFFSRNSLRMKAGTKIAGCVIMVGYANSTEQNLFQWPEHSEMEPEVFVKAV